MPLVKIHYVENPKKEILNSLSVSLSQVVAESLSKSEDFVMIVFQKTELQSFGNDSITSSIYVELKNVGTLHPETTCTLSSKITELLVNVLNVESSRIYIEFQASERHHWGWNGKTFSK